VAELRHLHRLLARKQEFAVAGRLHVGDWVRVVAGPLVGVEGTVAHLSQRMRLNMNVTILGQSVSIEVDGDTVERIDRPAYA
jgi:transcription antitermination factor NusG